MYVCICMYMYICMYIIYVTLGNNLVITIYFKPPLLKSPVGRLIHLAQQLSVRIIDIHDLGKQRRSKERLSKM